MTDTFEICDLSAHPEYARRVGEIVSLWALIELRLSLIFGALLRAPPWTAWEAFFAIKNTRARTDMIRALAITLDSQLPERDELLGLVKRVGQAPAARHGYAHKPWVFDSGKLYQLDMPAVPIEQSVKHPITLKQLEVDLDALRHLHDDVRNFYTRFAGRYPLQLEAHVSRLPQAWPGKWPQHIRRTE